MQQRHRQRCPLSGARPSSAAAGARRPRLRGRRSLPDVSRQVPCRGEVPTRHAEPPGIAPLALCLFRITQESLQNVIKHSGAATATVRLTHTGQDVRLHITDTGKGFEPDSRKAAGFGLLSMRERVHYAGWISIRAAAGRGKADRRHPADEPVNRMIDRPPRRRPHPSMVRTFQPPAGAEQGKPLLGGGRPACISTALELRLPRTEPDYTDDLAEAAAALMP